MRPSKRLRTTDNLRLKCGKALFTLLWKIFNTVSSKDPLLLTTEVDVILVFFFLCQEPCVFVHPFDLTQTISHLKSVWFKTTVFFCSPCLFQLYFDKMKYPKIVHLTWTTGFCVASHDSLSPSLHYRAHFLNFCFDSVNNTSPFYICLFQSSI